MPIAAAKAWPQVQAHVAEIEGAKPMPVLTIVVEARKRIERR